jgi:uncharacterized protein (TIGR00290 family)
MDNLHAIASWSGGKDSCLACYKAMSAGYKVTWLLNFISRDSKRGCFHGLQGKLLSLQASLIGIPLTQEEVSADMQKYEGEFKAVVRKLQSQGAKAMVFGDIYLLEHASWVERVCNDLEIRAVEPLWNISTEEIIEEFLTAGFKAIIVSCKADCMGKEFIGRVIDRGLIKELQQRGVCPCGEKGEYHTLVVDGPIFKRPLEIIEATAILKEGFWKHWFLDIKRYS